MLSRNTDNFEIIKHMQMETQHSILNTTLMERSFDGVWVEMRLRENPLRKSQGLKYAVLN